MNRRGEVIDYVTQKYGRENVAQIITFGTMAGQGGDQGRRPRHGHAVRRRGPHRQDGPERRWTSRWTRRSKEAPQLQSAYENDPQVRELLDTARKLEGLVRHAGVHAAGVVIAPQPLIELVPLYKTKNDEIVTAFDMKAVEKMGLLKMDFLGLSTLTILDDALKLIAQTTRRRRSTCRSCRSTTRRPTSRSSTPA